MVRNVPHAKRVLAHLEKQAAAADAAPAATPAERKSAERARNTEKGLRRFEAWAHPDDFESIRTYIDRKLRKRGLV